MTKDQIKLHLASFAKTYVTVFLTLYLYGIDQGGNDMFDLVFIGEAAKYSLLSVIRTAYKVLTEK
jgi:hypothetical protein